MRVGGAGSELRENQAPGRRFFVTRLQVLRELTQSLILNP